MKRLTFAKIVLLFLIVDKFPYSLAFDDERCDQELNRFDLDLEKRELWALKCEKARFCFN